MHCPFCRHADSRVVDSRTSDDGASIRRRRQCPECNRRFTTIETASLSVVKRSGVTEPFSREKIVNGVRKACQGRPVNEDDLAVLAQRVEETIRASGSAELDAYEIGLAILGPLRELDEVAYPASRASTRRSTRSRTSRAPSRRCAWTGRNARRRPGVRRPRPPTTALPSVRRHPRPDSRTAYRASCPRPVSAPPAPGLAPRVVEAPRRGPRDAALGRRAHAAGGRTRHACYRSLRARRPDVDARVHGEGVDGRELLRGEVGASRAARFSSSCRVELAPSRTDVTRSSRSAQRIAVDARVRPWARASLSRWRTRSRFSSGEERRAQRTSRAARSPSGTPWR